MATASTTLDIIVKLTDEASSAMQGLGSNFQDIGKKLTSTGKTLTTDVTLPLAGIATAATYAASQFQASMELLHTQAGATQEEVQNMSQAILNMVAAGASQTPEQLSAALYHIESAGIRGAQALDALKVASEGADVGQTDLEGVTNALVGAIATGIKGAQDYQQAMGTLNAVVGAGNMRMQDLVAALSTGILPAAKSVGLSLQDVGAALAVMTAQGVPAEDAATRLRMTFSLMEAPSGAAVKAFKQIGLSSTQLAEDMKNGGIVQAIDDLKTHLEDSGKTAIQQQQIISQAFGGGRTSSAILSLLQSTGRLKEAYTQIGDSAGNFSSLVQAQDQTAQESFDRMKATLSAAAIQIGNALLPLAVEILPKLANALSAVVAWFTNLPAPVRDGIIIFLGLLAALGPLLVVIGTLITSIGSIITVIGTISAVVGPALAALGAIVAAIGLWPILIGAAVALVVVLIVTHWTQVKNFLVAVGTDILNVVTTAWNAIKNVVTSVFSAMVEVAKFEIDLIVGAIVLALEAFDPKWREHWAAISAFFTDMWNTLKPFLLETWNWITSLFNTSLSGIQTVWNTVWGGVSSFFIGIWDGVKGALSSALGFLRSEIGAFVSWAEGVFAPVQSAVNAIGGAASGFMSAVKSGASAVASVGSQITHFATGGIVNGPTIALVGEAGPEAIIPLSSFNNGMSLAHAGSAGGGGMNVVVNINGGIIPADVSAVRQIGDMIARQITAQVRTANYAR